MDKSLNTGQILLIAGAAFSLLMTLFLGFEQYWFLAVPMGLLIAWMGFYRMDLLLFLVILCTPLSLNLEELDMGGIGFYFPTEPILFGVLGITILKVLSGKWIHPSILRHPISYWLYAFLGWMILTTITSELPVVSLKFILAKLWFIVPMYFLLAHVLQDRKNIRKVLMLYIVPLLIVVIYTVIHHSTYNFEKQPGHWVMTPFYKDHTSYGAVLAMYFPVAIGALITRRATLPERTFYITALVIITVGLIFSYTRAAWLSVVAAAVVFFFMWLRIRLNVLIGTVALLGVFFFMFQDQILISLERNTQDSSDDFAEHVESMSNVSTDASNLERLNRWNCALAMFEERPLLGWGPGTYQFVYAPFQRSIDETIISTNNADGGNAHSEYLGPLSEQGLPGMLLMIVLLILVSALAFRLYFELSDKELRIYVTITYLGLVTYFVHGVLNNYLDTDKASIPFWSFIAILVAIDLFHKKQKALSESGS